MNTLIVGCSFVENIKFKNPPTPQHVIGEQFTICGSSGAGNQSIAARVIHECSLKSYDQVVVLWSGINRLDFPVGIELHKVLPIDKTGYPVYQYWTRINHSIWYHSGGFRLSGTSDDCPKFFRDFFDHQYRSATPQYLSELSLLSIIQTQSFLKAKNIPSVMSFIYDVDHGYTESFIEPGCGKLDKSLPLAALVDWSMFKAQIPPFEYARSKNGLEPDGFHPLFDTMLEWFDVQLDINLKS